MEKEIPTKMACDKYQVKSLLHFKWYKLNVGFSPRIQLNTCKVLHLFACEEILTNRALGYESCSNFFTHQIVKFSIDLQSLHRCVHYNHLRQLVTQSVGQRCIVFVILHNGFPIRPAVQISQKVLELQKKKNKFILIKQAKLETCIPFWNLQSTSPRLMNLLPLRQTH